MTRSSLNFFYSVIYIACTLYNNCVSRLQHFTQERFNNTPIRNRRNIVLEFTLLPQPATRLNRTEQRLFRGKTFSNKYYRLLVAIYTNTYVSKRYTGEAFAKQFLNKFKLHNERDVTQTTAIFIVYVPQKM